MGVEQSLEHNLIPCNIKLYEILFKINTISHTELNRKIPFVFYRPTSCHLIIFTFHPENYKTSENTYPRQDWSEPTASAAFRTAQLTDIQLFVVCVCVCKCIGSVSHCRRIYCHFRRLDLNKHKGKWAAAITLTGTTCVKLEGCWSLCDQKDLQWCTRWMHTVTLYYIFLWLQLSTLLSSFISTFTVSALGRYLQSTEHTNINYYKHNAVISHFWSVLPNIDHHPMPDLAKTGGVVGPPHWPPTHPGPPLCDQGAPYYIQYAEGPVTTVTIQWPED